jgi:molecular chaperone DnaK
MVQDAESHREEDAKFHELVQARNHADALVHATRSAIKDNGDKVPGDMIGRAEAAIAEVESAIKSDDKGQIEAKSKALEEAGQALFAAAAAAQQGAESSAGPGGSAGGAGGAPRNDDVVDAEFTEVKDDGQQQS